MYRHHLTLLSMHAFKVNTTWGDKQDAVSQKEKSTAIAPNWTEMTRKGLQNQKSAVQFNSIHFTSFWSSSECAHRRDSLQTALDSQRNLTSVRVQVQVVPTTARKTGAHVLAGNRASLKHQRLIDLQVRQLHVCYSKFHAFNETITRQRELESYFM